GRPKYSQPFFQKKTARQERFFSPSPNTGPHSGTGTKQGQLPGKIQNNLAYAFGQDFSDVGIQKDSPMASHVNALAFTQGEQIHFAPGQFNPDTEKGKNLIGHEFAHIVQQRSGVV